MGPGVLGSKVYVAQVNMYHTNHVSITLLLLNKFDALINYLTPAIYKIKYACEVFNLKQIKWNINYRQSKNNDVDILNT